MYTNQAKICNFSIQASPNSFGSNDNMFLAALDCEISIAINDESDIVPDSEEMSVTDIKIQDAVGNQSAMGFDEHDEQNMIRRKAFSILDRLWKEEYQSDDQTTQNGIQVKYSKTLLQPTVKNPNQKGNLDTHKSRFKVVEPSASGNDRGNNDTIPQLNYANTISTQAGSSNSTQCNDTQNEKKHKCQIMNKTFGKLLEKSLEPAAESPRDKMKPKFNQEKYDRNESSQQSWIAFGRHVSDSTSAMSLENDTDSQSDSQINANPKYHNIRINIPKNKTHESANELNDGVAFPLGIQMYERDKGKLSMEKLMNKKTKASKLAGFKNRKRNTSMSQSEIDNDERDMRLQPTKKMKLLSKDKRSEPEKYIEDDEVKNTYPKDKGKYISIFFFIFLKICKSD